MRAAPWVLTAALTWTAMSARAQPGDDGVMVWAPPGSSAADLGRLFDAHFRPVRGTAYNGQSDTVNTSDTYREVVAETSRVELEARARFQGIGGAVQLGTTDSLGYIRAVSMRRVVRVPPTAEITAAPGAAYFVSEIRFGYAFELRVIGRSRDVAASVDTIAAGGGVRLATSSVRTEGGTRGLLPVGDELEAMAASTPSQILARFRVAREAPAALFFRLERLPAPARTSEDARGTGRASPGTAGPAAPVRDLRRFNSVPCAQSVQQQCLLGCAGWLTGHGRPLLSKRGSDSPGTRASRRCYTHISVCASGQTRRGVD